MATPSSGQALCRTLVRPPDRACGALVRARGSRLDAARRISVNSARFEWSGQDARLERRIIRRSRARSENYRQGGLQRCRTTSTLGVALDELFPAARQAGPPASSFSQCTSDWRQVQPGDAYVAVLGADADGHDHVAAGRASAAPRRSSPSSSCRRVRVPVYVVDDSRVALGELCHALAGHPSRQMRVIGVVGDQGKIDGRRAAWNRSSRRPAATSACSAASRASTA